MARYASMLGSAAVVGQYDRLNIRIDGESDSQKNDDDGSIGSAIPYATPMIQIPK
jgi:hypothetical protein